MKNFFVQTLVRVKSTDYGWKDRSSEGDLYKIYSRLQQISHASFAHNMKGDWEYVLLETEVDQVLQVFRNNFEQIYKLREENGPCNILFCGLDAQMIQPTEIFGRWDKFMMFNYTDPRSNSRFQHNFNCDVRYYPAEMEQKWWDYTLSASENLTVWEQEQNIYNDILWGQGVTVDQVLDPSLGFQAHMMAGPDNNAAFACQWNQFDINQAHIIHWHSSRGAQNRVDTMTEVSRRVGIPLPEATA